MKSIGQALIAVICLSILGSGLMAQESTSAKTVDTAVAQGIHQMRASQQYGPYPLQSEMASLPFAALVAGLSWSNSNPILQEYVRSWSYDILQQRVGDARVLRTHTYFSTPESQIVRQSTLPLGAGVQCAVSSSDPMNPDGEWVAALKPILKQPTLTLIERLRVLHLILQNPDEWEKAAQVPSTDVDLLTGVFLSHNAGVLSEDIRVFQKAAQNRLLKNPEGLIAVLPLSPGSVFGVFSTPDAYLAVLESTWKSPRPEVRASAVAQFWATDWSGWSEASKTMPDWKTWRMRWDTMHESFSRMDKRVLLASSALRTPIDPVFQTVWQGWIRKQVLGMDPEVATDALTFTGGPAVDDAQVRMKAIGKEFVKKRTVKELEDVRWVKPTTYALQFLLNEKVPPRDPSQPTYEQEVAQAAAHRPAEAPCMGEIPMDILMQRQVEEESRFLMVAALGDKPAVDIQYAKTLLALIQQNTR